MGGGAWTHATYAATTATKVAAGTTFAHSATARATKNWDIHETLDPTKPNSAGEIIREARDSDDHPTSKAVAVIHDHTGSMGSVPPQVIAKLPALLGLVQRKGYLEDPQILFGAIGDAKVDRAVVQIGQFESDNRMDEQLDNIILYGGGGGSNQESYELIAYFFANAVSMDCLEKRGEKGYLFIIGDEQNYPTVKADEIREHLGLAAQADLDTEDVYAALREKFEVFFLVPPHTFHYNDPRLLEHWENLVGTGHVVKCENVELIPETIATIIGIQEGTVTLDDLDADLADVGASSTDIDTVKSSVTDIQVASTGNNKVTNVANASVEAFPANVTDDSEDGLVS